MPRKYHPIQSRMVVSSVEVIEGPAHDVVKIWNRGGLAGELTVTKGDGAVVAARLRTNEPHLKIQPARESHLSASVHIVRSPGDLIRDDREGVWVEVDRVGVTQHDERFVDLRVSHIVWHEDGTGLREPDRLVRAYPDREWDPTSKAKRIELLEEHKFEWEGAEGR